MEILETAVTFVVAARHRNLLVGLALGTLAVALGGVAFLLFGLKDPLSRYPGLT